jgi:hypothetical protein
MPIIRESVVASDGPIVRVRFHFSDQELFKRRSAGLATAQPVEVNALIDTGAEMTCLDVALVRRIGLPPAAVGLANVPATGGLNAASDYDASVAILHPSGRPSNNLVIPELLITGLQMNTTGYDAVIGRDVLAYCILVYDGPTGAFVLTY